MASSNYSSYSMIFTRRPRLAAGDRLMSLPTELLDDILARLLFKQLVRTSVLSHAWRRRWESVPNLDIRVFGRAPDPRLLRRCAAPVRGFTARIGRGHFERANDMLRALAGKRVQKLAVDLVDPLARAMGDSIGICIPALFSFRDIVHLDLGGCCWIPEAPPGFRGFPKLRTLALNHVRFPFEGGGPQLARMIYYAPGLTELSLIDVRTTDFPAGSRVYRCSIYAPNLRVLKLAMLEGDNGCRLAGKLPQLEEAVISIQVPFRTNEFLKIFRRISGAKSLTFTTNSHKVDENPLERIYWKHQNLKVGSLRINFGKLCSIESIFSLLRCAPHIERLEIEVEEPKMQIDEDDVDVDPEVDDDDFLFFDDIIKDKINEDILSVKASDACLLKHVSVTGIRYFMPNEICFIKFLLSKSESLASFVATFRFEEIKEQARPELAAWEKASPQAKISVRLLDGRNQNPYGF